MKKYDCSKIIDFRHEKNRLCNIFRNGNNGCYNCPLSYPSFTCDINSIDKHSIEKIQKWSDEHPEKTREEALNDILTINFPKFNAKYKVNHGLCFATLIGKKCKEIYKDRNISPLCSECWEMPYNGEFEK